MSEAQEVAVGDPLLPRTVGPVTQTDILRFAGASGDFNPLHHDPEVARRAGFDAPIAMGQMTAGIVAAWVADWCGVERLVEIEVRFVAPVLVGETIALTGSVAELGAVDGAEMATVLFQAAKGDVVVARGLARIASRR